MTAWVASSGPCYYGHVVAGVDPYEPLLARLDAIGSEQGELKARFNQKGLWQLSSADEWGILLEFPLCQAFMSASPF